VGRLLAYDPRRKGKRAAGRKEQAGGTSWASGPKRMKGRESKGKWLFIFLNHFQTHFELDFEFSFVSNKNQST